MKLAFLKIVSLPHHCNFRSAAKEFSYKIRNDAAYKCFVILLEQKDAATLLQLIKQYVVPETIIMSNQ